MQLTSKPKAFLCRRYTPNIEAALRERFDVQINEDDSILKSAEIARLARGSELLFISATEVVDKAAIAGLAPMLRTIATLSVGFDHIDIEAAREAGVRVLHTPDVLSDACAEIAMMLVLNACRRGLEADRMVRSGAWPGWGPTQLLGMGLVGKRIGIFGMGRIGTAIALRARAFGLDVHYHNRTRAVPDNGAVYHETLDSLLQVSNILMIAAPGAPSLRGVIDANRILLLPHGAVVVNISRGDLVDDHALVEALQNGRVRGAGLDVFANEPNIHPSYRELDNVFLTPHIGSATDETRDAMGWLLIHGVEELARGETPKNLLC